VIEEAKKKKYPMYYTYVLLSLRDNKFYVGYTSDIRKRLKMHKNGLVVSTKSRGEFKLIYCEICLNKYDALDRERYFKTGFGRRFLNNRLKNFLK